MKQKFFVSVMLFIFCNLSNSQSLPDYVPSNGIIGWYPFNSNSNDESGNGNHAIAYGSSLANDRFGNTDNAYYFNGAGNYMSVTPISPLDFQNGLSISLWTKIVSPIINPNNLAAFLVSRGNDTQEGHFHLAYDQQAQSADNGQHFQADVNGLGNSVYSSYAVPYPQTTWHHVVMVHDNITTKIYLDGVLSNSREETNAVADITSQILFGKHQNAAFPYYLKGLLDDIGIWNRPLTAEEISHLFGSNLSTASVTVKNEFVIYPNPLKRGEAIKVQQDSTRKGYVAIFDLMGRRILNATFETSSINLSSSSLQSGIYLVSVYDVTMKVIGTKKIVIE